MYKDSKTAVIVAAAGQGKRLGAPVPKQYLKIGGEHVIAKAIKPFEDMDEIDSIFVVVNEDYMQLCSEIAEKNGFAKIRGIVAGGRERQDSVQNAIRALNSQAPDTQIVLIHDGARPFIEKEIILNVLRSADETGAAVPCIPMTNSIRKLATGTVSGEPATIKDSGNRANNSEPGRSLNNSEPGQHPKVSESGRSLNNSEPGQRPNISEPGQHPNISESGQHPNISESGQHPNISEPGQRPNISESGRSLNDSEPGQRPKKSISVDRSEYFAVQTPQGFRKSTLIKAYEKAAEDGYMGTDDASVVERAGYEITITEGSRANIKITTKEDMPMENRIGTGFDVHRLVEGRKLILGGVEIPYQLGLDGHSDADVLIHAVMDALLGAAALGDIGRHFPDTDSAYKGISSMKLLLHVNRLLRENQFKVGNIDVTLIAQRPKISPYVEEMRSNLAEALEIDMSRINIKGTTTEKLGFTGRGEGIACEAVAGIYR